MDIARSQTLVDVKSDGWVLIARRYYNKSLNVLTVVMIFLTPSSVTLTQIV